MKTISKGFTGLGGFILLVIGIGMLIVTIWAFTHAALAFNNYKFLTVVLILDIAIILASVLGIIGVKKQNGCLIFIFQILVMIFFFAFLAIGISAMVLPKKVFDTDCNGTGDDLVSVAKQVYDNATVSLCGIICQCGLTNASIDTGNYSIIEKTYLKALNRADGAS